MPLQARSTFGKVPEPRIGPAQVSTRGAPALTATTAPGLQVPAKEVAQPQFLVSPDIGDGHGDKLGTNDGESRRCVSVGIAGSSGSVGNCPRMEIGTRFSSGLIRAP